MTKLAVTLCLLFCLLQPVQAKRLETKTGDSEFRIRQIIEVKGFGATPDAANMPLGLCQGDCDTDEDASFPCSEWIPSVLLNVCL
jgi:hypothetical protein